MTIADWFAGTFATRFESVTTVTVLKVDPDTAATVSQSTGVTAYRKGGSGQMVADGPLVRTCQWRLLASGLSSEPEVNALIVEADGTTTWQITSVASEVFGVYRVCQCARVT